MMSTYLTRFKFKIIEPQKTHFTDGLQSIPQWESAFNYPSGGKVLCLILALFDNINDNLSWDYSMPSRFEYSKHKEWSFIDPIH